MNKQRKVLLILLVSLIVILLSINTCHQSDYKNQISSFSQVNIQLVEDKIAKKEDFILYIGRETCPECVNFVPLLSETAREGNVTVLYLDSTNTDKSRDIKEFRDKYSITYVPSLLIHKDGRVNFPKIPLNKDDMSNIFKGYGIIK